MVTTATSTLIYAHAMKRSYAGPLEVLSPFSTSTLSRLGSDEAAQGELLELLR